MASPSCRLCPPDQGDPRPQRAAVQLPDLALFANMFVVLGLRPAVCCPYISAIHVIFDGHRLRPRTDGAQGEL